MTAQDDPALDDHTRDELVSAHLDGEATDEEAAMVAGDPALQARRATFAAGRDAVKADISVPTDEARDALLARVIGTAIAPPKVVPMRRRFASPRVLAAAAAIVAVAFLGGAIALLADEGRDGDQDASTTLRDDAALSTGGDAATDTTATGATAQPPYLGEFADATQLTAAITAAERAAGQAGAADEALSAESAAPENPSTSKALEVTCPVGASVAYLAVLDGQDVLVLVDGGLVTVLALADCSPVASVTR
jgi:hypothetical protein